MLSLIAFTWISALALFVILKFRQPKLTYPSPPRAVCITGSRVDADGVCAAHGESACVLSVPNQRDAA